jgi:hypothetical protein
VPFVTDADRDYMIQHDPKKANALLDEMGLKRGAEHAHAARRQAVDDPVGVQLAVRLAGLRQARVQGYWRAVGLEREC